MSKPKITVVTYVQASGRKATTTVTPQQLQALQTAGRLVQTHPTTTR